MQYVHLQIIKHLTTRRARIEANLLKPALARGELQCMGATTLDEYRQYIEKDQTVGGAPPLAYPGVSPKEQKRCLSETCNYALTKAPGRACLNRTPSTKGPGAGAPLPAGAGAGADRGGDRTDPPGRRRSDDFRALRFPRRWLREARLQCYLGHSHEDRVP